MLKNSLQNQESPMISGPKGPRVTKVRGGLHFLSDSGFPFVCRLETLRSLRSRMFLARCARASSRQWMLYLRNISALLASRSNIILHTIYKCGLDNLLFTSLVSFRAKLPKRLAIGSANDGNNIFFSEFLSDLCKGLGIPT